MEQKNARGVALAILAAALYALSAPFSKLLLRQIPPTLTAGFLYLGAGAGMAALTLARKMRRREGGELRLTRAELPFVIAMIALDIAAPICLLKGLADTTAANAALLNNFEIVATAVIALAVFHERVSPRLWLGIALVTVACAMLSFEGGASLRFSRGSALVLLAAACWGFENNCTRRLSGKDPRQIVLLKGIFSGLGSLAIGLCLGERVSEWTSVPAALLLGFVAYGLSIYFYVYAQRLLGAARTSAYYAVSPFIAAALSLVMFRQRPARAYCAALLLMAAGAWLCAQDKPLFRRKK